MFGSHTSSRTAYRSRRLFYKSHLSLIPSLLLTKPNPLRWAPVWPWLQGRSSSVYAAGALYAVADCISFATTFLQKSSLTHSVAPPHQTEPAALGSGLALAAKPEQQRLCCRGAARCRGLHIVRDGFFIAAGFLCCCSPDRLSCPGSFYMPYGFSSRSALSGSTPGSDRA